MKKQAFFLIISPVVFASFIKGEASYYDDIFELAISLNNTIVEERRENPEVSLNLGVYQEKTNLGALIGGKMKRRFLEYEASLSTSYVFMKNSDICLLDFEVLDHKTKRMSLVYGGLLKVYKEKNNFFIGVSLLYEISPSLRGGISLKFGHSLRLGGEVIYR